MEIVKKRDEKNIYGVGMLVYPGIDNNWNYLFGAILIVHQMKKDIWFQKNCDFLLLTPKINDIQVINLINRVFDMYVIYNKSLKLNSDFTFEKKWHGVFNKLYYWNQEVFDYKRILIMDTDIFVFKPSGYIKALTDIKDGIGGAYENGFVNSNKNLDLRFGTIIPTQYTSYKNGDKSNYNMVNAGLLSIEPDCKIFDEMTSDLEAGWKIIEKKYKALAGKIGKNIYPEQEYLTGYFSGRWRSLPSEDFLSIKPTINHWCDGQKKYWDEFPKRMEDMMGSICKEVIMKYPELKKLNISKKLLSSSICVILRRK
jgi:hypothetical protein